ncbi:hypothetical protein K2X85_20230 [bacterium]|nr:hypothetical protein [bacterium]
MAGSIKRWAKLERLPSAEADRILADLAELLIRVKNPLLQQILRETSDQINELLLPEADDEHADLDQAA